MFISSHFNIKIYKNFKSGTTEEMGYWFSDLLKIFLIVEIETNHKENLKCIMYGDWFDDESLQKWKKRTLFPPYYLKLLDK